MSGYWSLTARQMATVSLVSPDSQDGIEEGIKGSYCLVFESFGATCVS